MIVFGVVKREDVLPRYRFSRLRPRFSFALLGEFADPLSEEDEEALAIIYREMGSIPKNTWAGRLSAVDDALVAEIAARFPATAPLRVHDMAVSNAITSVELFERLRERPNLSFVASDYFDAIDVVDVPDSQWRIIFDAARQPLQFVGRRLVIDAQRRERRRFPVNRLLRHIVAARIVPKARAILDRGGAEHIRLFHPRAQALSVQDPRFQLERDDAINPAERTFEVIRVTGLFSKGRFPRATIEAALDRIARNLTENGLLVLGSHWPGKDASEATITLFARKGDRLTVVSHLGLGTPLREIALGVRIPRSAAATANTRR
jgi:hypothetical protein